MVLAQPDTDASEVTDSVSARLKPPFPIRKMTCSRVIWKIGKSQDRMKCSSCPCILGIGSILKQT